LANSASPPKAESNGTSGIHAAALRVYPLFPGMAAVNRFHTIYTNLYEIYELINSVFAVIKTVVLFLEEK
jgi:hypothetical protein